MPGYISHTVMARDIYKRIPHDNISLDYLETYSLGGDLCKYAKCRYDSHHKDMDKFIYTMADYIKENNLLNNKALISVLYAHICHYIMDNTIHPLVRIIDKTSVKHKRNHTLIELYYDAYLTKNIFNTKIDKYATGKILSAKNNRLVNKMINYTYDKVYQTKHIARYYRFNLGLYRKIKYLYKLLGYRKLKKISGINEYLANNSDLDLTNTRHLISYKDYHGILCHDDLDTAYHKTITRAIKYIEDINKYLNI